MKHASMIVTGWVMNKLKINAFAFLEIVYVLLPLSNIEIQITTKFMITH